MLSSKALWYYNKQHRNIEWILYKTDQQINIYLVTDYALSYEAVNTLTHQATAYNNWLNIHI